MTDVISNYCEDRKIKLLNNVNEKILTNLGIAAFEIQVATFWIFGNFLEFQLATFQRFTSSTGQG